MIMNRKLLTILLGFTLTAAATSCRAVEQATIKPAQGTPVTLGNPDFSDGAKSWILRDSAQLDAVYQADKTPEGKPALSIHLDENSPTVLKDSAYIARRDFPVEAGYYQLQFQMSSDLQSGNAGLHILAQKKDKSYIQILNAGQGGAPRLAGKTAWTNYFVVYKIPEDVTATVIQFETNSAQGTVSLADVSLDRLSDAAGKALMQQINPQVESAQDYGAKMMATPCRVANAALPALRGSVVGRYYKAHE